MCLRTKCSVGVAHVDVITIIVSAVKVHKWIGCVG